MSLVWPGAPGVVGVSGSAPSWVMRDEVGVPAGLALNFALRSYRIGRKALSSADLSTVISAANSTGGYVYSAAGTLTAIAANLPRLTYDKLLGRYPGLLVEESTQNNTLSSNFTGAVVGVVGSGGALPTGWNKPTACSLEVLAIGTDYIDIRLFGTASSSTLDMRIAAVVAALTGETWTTSGDIQKIAGGTGITGENIAILENVTYRTRSIDVQSDVPFPATQRITMGSDTNISTRFVLSCTNGQAVDVSYRLYSRQLEKKAFRTSPFPAAASAATRNADDITLTDATVVGLSAFTVGLEAIGPEGDGTATLFQADDGTADNRITVSIQANDVILSSVISGVVTTANLGTWMPMTKGRVVLKVTGGTVKASFSGNPVQTIGSVPTGLNRALIGSGADGYWNSVVTQLQSFNRAVSDAQLLVLAKINWLYDSFDRADGTIGTAPTGQAWSQVPTSQGSQVKLGAISSSKLVTADSGQSTTASYSGVDRTALPSVIAGGCTFTNATNGGSLTMIMNPNGLGTIANVTDGSMHCVFTNANFLLQKYASGSPSTVKQVNYFTALTKDDATPYYFAMFFDLTANAVIVRGGDGHLYRIISATLIAAGGRYCIWESFWGTGQTQTKILASLLE